MQKQIHTGLFVMILAMGVSPFQGICAEEVPAASLAVSELSSQQKAAIQKLYGVDSASADLNQADLTADEQEIAAEVKYMAAKGYAKEEIKKAMAPRMKEAILRRVQQPTQ